jgi:hypothetical protein
MSKSRAEKMAYLEKDRICTRKHCRTHFSEDSNIGSWECEWYHPAFNLPRGRLGEYKCCWRAEDSEGCVKADHIDITVDAKGRKEIAQDPNKMFDRILRTKRDCQIEIKEDDLVLFEKKQSRTINEQAWETSKDGTTHTVTRLDFNERRIKMSQTLKMPVRHYDIPRHAPY